MNEGAGINSLTLSSRSSGSLRVEEKEYVQFHEKFSSNTSLGSQRHGFSQVLHDSKNEKVAVYDNVRCQDLSIEYKDKVRTELESTRSLGTASDVDEFPSHGGYEEVTEL